MSDEPALTYLMPAYNLASWVLLATRPDDFAFPVSLFGASWALRNIYKFGRLDAGVISMGVVAAASGAEKQFYGGANTTLILIQVRHIL